MSQSTDRSWFERNVGTLFWVLVGLCVLAAAADVLSHRADHAHFGWEKIPAFHGVFGFVVFVTVVYLGMGLRRLVRRDEDYYD